MRRGRLASPDASLRRRLRRARPQLPWPRLLRRHGRHRPGAGRREDFALAGHSMGGRVAMLIAATVPRRVRRLALLDTAAHLPTSAEAERRLGLIALGDRDGIEAVIQEWLPPMIAPDRLGDAALWDASAAMIRRAGLESLRSQQKALLERPDGFAHLDTVKVPTAFIVGALDVWSPVEGHVEMQAHVAGSTLTVIEDCGHMAPTEDPEAVNRALAAWLERA
ncbi:MAG: alpha/beta fold hydrolase [Caulobacteraceae bacterium]